MHPNQIPAAALCPADYRSLLAIRFGYERLALPSLFQERRLGPIPLPRGTPPKSADGFLPGKHADAWLLLAPYAGLRQHTARAASRRKCLSPPGRHGLFVARANDPVWQSPLRPTLSSPATAGNH